MKFNTFIGSLREKGNSQFSDNQISTDVICIDQISHPINNCLLYTSPSPRDRNVSRMPSSA